VLSASGQLTQVNNPKELELKIKKIAARQGGIGANILLFYRNAVIDAIESNGLWVTFQDTQESAFVEFYLVSTSVGNALVPKNIEES